MGEDDPSAPVTACRRCRKQKLRCSRDVPTCKRCKDISAACDYPPPPDRKALAAQRLQNAKARVRRESEISGSLQDYSRPPDIDPALPSREPSIPEVYRGTSSRARSEADEDSQYRSKASDECPSPSAPLHAVLRRTTLPSSEVAVFLIEIYFQRMYNAHLLFHKGTFLADYAASRVPDFVALSVFAVATIFLRQSSQSGGQARQHQDEDGVDLGVSMVSAADWTRQGLEWATAAGQRVLMQSDVPRIETVQACQNVGLYWFSLGQGDRCHVLTIIAYKVARLLNLHVQQESIDVTDPLAAEGARRCFWACWMTSCFSQDNANFKAEPYKEVINLAFPCSEESFVAGYPISVEAWDDSGDLVSMSESKSQPSVFGELIKLLHLLWEIQNFGKHHGDGNSADPSGKFTALLELDRRLSNVIESFHPDLKYTPGSFASSKQDPHKIFQLHCVHRLSACALHSSIVPLFSATPSNSQVSSKLLRLSAEEAVKQSDMCLDMATAFLNTRPDISRLPGITGYAMFVASTIHFKSLGAQRKLQARGVGRLKAAVTIIEQLKSYWTILNGLWSQLRTLFATAGLDIDLISSSQNRSRSGSDEQPTDLDRIVAHKNTPEESGTTDLYTYISDQEVRVTSPPRHSDTNSIRRSSSHNTSSPVSRDASTPAQEWRRPTALPVIGNRQSSLDQRTYGQAYQQMPPMPPTQLPLPQGFEQRFHNSLSTNNPSPPYLPPPSQVQHPAYIPHQSQPLYKTPPNLSIPKTSPSMHTNAYQSHQPLPHLAENFPLQDSDVSQMQQTRHPNPNPTQSPGYSVGGFPDPGVLAMEMEIDAVSLWWDQSFGTFEMEGLVQGQGQNQQQISRDYPDDGAGGGHGRHERY